MNIYKTNNFEFNFIQEEIRLYRNGFNYLTIPFSEVHHLEVKRGRVVRNAGILAIIAGFITILIIALIANFFLGIFYSFNYTILNHSDIRRIGVNIILILVSIFGASFLFHRIIRKEWVLKINHKKQPYPLEELEKSGNLEGFRLDIKKVFNVTLS